MTGRPLFALADEEAQGSPRRCGTHWLTKLVKDLPRALDLARFDPDGRGEPEPLKLVPRRLRYTFAKRQALIMRVEPRILAELLDHGSVATVLVYYEPGLDLVAVLGRCLGRDARPFRRSRHGACDGPSRDRPSARRDPPRADAVRLPDLPEVRSGLTGRRGNARSAAPIAPRGDRCGGRIGRDRRTGRDDDAPGHCRSEGRQLSPTP